LAWGVLELSCVTGAALLVWWSSLSDRVRGATRPEQDQKPSPAVLLLSRTLRRGVEGFADRRFEHTSLRALLALPLSVGVSYFSSLCCGEWWARVRQLRTKPVT
jgi:hypothetical protein